MFGLVAFAEYPFALLPNSGPITIIASVTETVTATDSSISVNNHDYLTESVTASDAYSAGIVYSKSITESVTATDSYQSPAIEVANLFGFTAFAEAPFAGLTPVPSRNTYADLIEAITTSDSISALVQFGALISESVSATDTVEETPTNVEQVIESVSAVDSIDTLASSTASLTESVLATDTVSSLAYLLAALTESISATDVYVYLSTTTADLTETVSSSDASDATVGPNTSTAIETVITTDSYSPAGSTYNVSLSANVTAQDFYLGGGSTSADILEVVYANSTCVSRFLWENIDDTQTANWGNISTSQTANWGAVDTTQTPNWNPINTSG